MASTCACLARRSASSLMEDTCLVVYVFRRNTSTPRAANPFCRTKVAAKVTTIVGGSVAGMFEPAEALPSMHQRLPYCKVRWQTGEGHLPAGRSRLWRRPGTAPGACRRAAAAAPPTGAPHQPAAASQQANEKRFSGSVVMRTVGRNPRQVLNKGWGRSLPEKARMLVVGRGCFRRAAPCQCPPPRLQC